ncbi:RNA polymerase sigma factor [uncultured Marinobacter sp.]|uniref:RNA polymerase sigma factor n=1 Tax=uncultured Marinobacter sp. TaxID=187379 RepID=UPI002625CCD0|nr:RNA polymerase sigma factor [uncultured Marinobacter sp.]
MDTLDLETVYRQHSRQVLATLIRLLGEFDLAEEALQDAFAAAAQQWPEQGVPDNPLAWLIRCGQNRGIDQIRRRQTVRFHADELARTLEESDTPDLAESSLQDDQLRLIFTCCHPALAVDAQLALTLREVCGLTTEQVARALLQKPTTLAQKIVRAKRKIREAGIPYEVPDDKHLAERLGAVLHVVYLMFNEGYARTDGEGLIDASLTAEAIRLAELLATLLPNGEVFGLLALMGLQDARKAARVDEQGELVTLEEQDRTLWDRDEIRLGKSWLMRALGQAPAGPYTLQAAIAAAHADAPSFEETDWHDIVGLYDLLYQRSPTPVIALNRAVAVAMVEGPQAGVALLEGLSSDKAIQNYHLFHAALADLHRRAGHQERARVAYERALSLASQAQEKRFLQKRLFQLDGGGCQ